MDLRNDIANVEHDIAAVKQRLIDEIQALPDNQLIQRGGSNPSCFVVRSSDLLDNWTPEFHDFRHQYDLLASEIRSRRIESIIPLLKSVINFGQVQRAGNKRYIRFHPIVRQHIKRLFEPPQAL